MMWIYGDDRWGRMHDSDGVGWIMVVLMLVLVIAAVVAVIALLRGTMPLTSTPRPAAGGRMDARAILQDRFARGEIDESDYRARIRAREDTGPSGG